MAGTEGAPFRTRWLRSARGDALIVAGVLESVRLWPGRANAGCHGQASVAAFGWFGRWHRACTTSYWMRLLLVPLGLSLALGCGNGSSFSGAEDGGSLLQGTQLFF